MFRSMLVDEIAETREKEGGYLPGVRTVCPGVVDSMDEERLVDTCRLEAATPFFNASFCGT